jgi:hypothetical protein
VIDQQVALPQRLSDDPRRVEGMKSLAAVLQDPNQGAIVYSRDRIAKTEVVWAKASQTAAIYDVAIQDE